MVGEFNLVTKFPIETKLFCCKKKLGADRIKLKIRLKISNFKINVIFLFLLIRFGNEFCHRYLNFRPHAP